MRRYLPVLAVLGIWAASAHAHGLLIPEDRTLPPLAMLDHKVHIAIDDQVATTTVEQTFRNHTDRPLEATYVFPVPKGASVNHFAMFLDGKEVKGELLEADKARDTYAAIVRRTQDPGLLEYMGDNLLRLKVFPIPAKSDQKVKLQFAAVAQREGDLVEYVYPLKTDGKATRTLQAFAIEATIKSQHAIQNVYSPTHAITLTRQGDRDVTVHFERNQGLLDKDFQLFYQVGDKDVGLTALTYRPLSTEPGYFLLLVSPKVEMSQSDQVPRDVVMVLDTSGSMRGPKMEQARKALKVCLENLGAHDRFALMNFATTVNKYRDNLLPVSAEQLTHANKWVDALEATGGTAINDALSEALALRAPEEGRSFTVVFFTDGQPTIGETNVDKILKNVSARNTANTRIFTFGVGDDVNATFLDSLAEQTRAVATYVRPAEDIAAKVSGLVGKISHPVLTDLKLAVTNDVHLSEVYPSALPDLFHGQQLVVLGRYTGKGPSAVKLSGQVGKESREFVYELTFADKTSEEKGFVEEIWARRKVGYLLDQIRANGEKKELVDEVVALAKRYGITTPYTSYLIVPDGAVPVASTAPVPVPGPVPGPGTPAVGFTGGFPGNAPPKGGNGGFGGGGFGGMYGFNGGSGGVPAGLQPGYAMPLGGAPGTGTASTTHPTGAPVPTSAPPPQTVAEYARQNAGGPGLAQNRANFEGRKYDNLPADGKGGDKEVLSALRNAKDKRDAYEQARRALAERAQGDVQAGKLGVDLSIQTNNMRNQSQVEFRALRNVNGRNCLELGGVWIDEGFDPKMPVVTVKAQSDAYFDLLARQPKLKEVFQLGNHLVWVTPNGTALIVDTNDGKDKLTKDEIDKLFVVKK